MNTPGTKTVNLYVAGDTDGLIAVLHTGDINHQRALSTLERLDTSGAMIIFPATCIVETVTTLIRRLNRADIAEHLIRSKLSQLWVEPVDQELINRALRLFDLRGSKQNTLFDAVVAGLAEKFKTTFIFSFDTWYSKQGFKLAEAMGKPHSI